jgi:sporulation protein YlmC with PRC-barrel domain
VHLKLSKEQEEELPAFVSARLVEPAEERYAPRTDSAFQPAPAHAPEIVDEDNLPEDSVTISEGADVVDRSGEKIGEVDDVIYDTGHRVEAIVVSSGFIFKDRIRIPAGWTSSATHDRIQIDRSAGDAERAGMLE